MDMVEGTGRRVLATVAIVMGLAASGSLTACSTTSGDGGGAAVSTGAITTDDGHQPHLPTNAESSDGVAALEPAATQTPDSSVPDLGLEEIVSEFTTMFYGGETVGADITLPSAYDRLKSADMQTRSRVEFEQQILGELALRFSDDPYYPQLFESLIDNWSLCLEEHGLPSLGELGQLSEDQREALSEELELSDQQISQLEGLEDRCWQRSRVYAGKDDETDRLLELQYQYYLNAAQEWVRANPQSVVPLAQ